jgi:hypothetical protein
MQVGTREGTGGKLGPAQAKACGYRRRVSPCLFYLHPELRTQSLKVKA